MGRFVVLLRGINVGGNNKLPMADLRSSLESAGYSNVQTYIQSGNVALDAKSCDTDSISQLIADDFGLTVPVVVRTAKQLDKVIDNNPFPKFEKTPKQLLVYFCSAKPRAETVEAFDTARFDPDQMTTIGSEAYVAYHEAVSKSKLTNVALDKAFGLTTTARNWSTVLKLRDLAATD